MWAVIAFVAFVALDVILVNKGPWQLHVRTYLSISNSRAILCCVARCCMGAVLPWSLLCYSMTCSVAPQPFSSQYFFVWKFMSGINWKSNAEWFAITEKTWKWENIQRTFMHCMYNLPNFQRPSPVYTSDSFFAHSPTSPLWPVGQIWLQCVHFQPLLTRWVLWANLALR